MKLPVSTAAASMTRAFPALRRPIRQSPGATAGVTIPPDRPALRPISHGLDAIPVSLILMRPLLGHDDVRVGTLCHQHRDGHTALRAATTVGGGPANPTLAHTHGRPQRATISASQTDRTLGWCTGGGGGAQRHPHHHESRRTLHAPSYQHTRSHRLRQQAWWTRLAPNSQTI